MKLLKIILIVFQRTVNNVYCINVMLLSRVKCLFLVGSTVAFFGRLDSNLANIGDNHVIPFEEVVSDTHSAFNGQTGVFTCPESGYYYFVVSLLAYPDAHVEAEIKLNGNGIVEVYARGVQANNQVGVFDHGTSGGVLYCNVNDKVWVQVNGDAHHGSGNILYYHYTSFSGFKI